jgi:nicotinate phosphoribosyltransferase
MTINRLDSLDEVSRTELSPNRLLSATHEEILQGWTTDIYFLKTREVLRSAGRLETPVTAEIFAREDGIFVGLREALVVLDGTDVPLQVEALPEGEPFSPKEVLLRIRGPYGAFGLFETVLLGMLASSAGWATAARACAEAAGEKPVLCFGARHVHPSVAPAMEYAAVQGGCAGASCILGAKLAGFEPKGTIPHAAILIMGDTLKLAEVYDRTLPAGEPRIVLVDTFKDEAEETLRVAEALGDRLSGVRLDTPGERGGVTPDLVREIRWRLDGVGRRDVKIIVSGGLNPDRIRTLSAAGADSFGVGSYIAHAAPRDMTMDLKEIDGVPRAKRGRLPGILPNPRLVRLR